MDVKPDVAVLFSPEVSHDDTVTMETKIALYNSSASTFLKALTKTILSRNAMDKQFQVQSILLSGLTSSRSSPDSARQVWPRSDSI